uniref:Uncharacterized protein n=1 Tax=Oryza sativa subsp. japonica TaxID=39947 RepID=Q10RL4_ORYSJ|nr:hypothetical protein LOC_Os03g05940 [Oryza sativa Japonica Group]
MAARGNGRRRCLLEKTAGAASGNDQWCGKDGRGAGRPREGGREVRMGTSGPRRCESPAGGGGERWSLPAREEDGAPVGSRRREANAGPPLVAAKLMEEGATAGDVSEWRQAAAGGGKWQWRLGFTVGAVLRG